MKNRLNLNFQLESADERADFVQKYIQEIDFAPTDAELETIANYILWGKDASGRNAQQAGDVHIKDWAPTQVESIEGLIEQPGFKETSFQTLSEPATRKRRIVFDREDALTRAPEHIRQLLVDLFRQIDTIELTLNYYELYCGRRVNPPRSGLLARFTEEEQQKLNENALKLTQFKYLKLKHLLVDLRSQQYTYQDCYQTKIAPRGVPNLVNENIYIGADITAFPAGLKNDTALGRKIFNIERMPQPQDFSEEDLNALSDLLWSPQSNLFIDFTDESHILELYKLKEDFYSAGASDPDGIYGASAALLDTLLYYEQHAKLNDLQDYILKQKLAKSTNADIAKSVNAKFNKSYNENYISTIFHQKIIPSIAAAAREHRKILENVFYPENFKKCKDCGNVYLLDSDHFVRQKKSADGFAPRCKACEKIKRLKRNETN